MEQFDSTGAKFREFYTIGETSKLNNVTPRALYHYENKKMLIPSSINPNNGYRKYKYTQFFLLDIIKRFKRCGVPLEDLQKMITSKDRTYAQELLETEILKIQREIDRLQLVKKDVEFFKYFYDIMPDVIKNSDIALEKHTLNHMLAVPVSPDMSYNEKDFCLRTRIHSPLFRDTKFFLPCGFLLDIEAFLKGNIKETHRTCYLIHQLDFNHPDYLYIKDSDAICITLTRGAEKQRLSRIQDFLKKQHMVPQYILCEEFYDEVSNVEEPLRRVKVIL